MKRTFLIFLSFFLITWEYVARVYPHLAFVLPPPSSIFMTIWEMRSRFWLHTTVTLKEMCCGFLFALIFSFPLAWMMIRYRRSRSILQPLFILIQSIPMFALAPIMVVWLGWGPMAIVIPTALMIFFPLTLGIYQGLRSTPEDLLEFFKTNQATPWQTFYKLQLPWALPHIFTGFRISAAIAGISTVAGEWAGAQEGLGVLMLESRRNIDLDITFGALFCLTALSALLYFLIILCEKITLHRRALPFLILTLFLTSCHSPSTTKSTRLMLDWLPNPNHIPLYVGLEHGFFEEEGIHLTLHKMPDGGGGISYLIANKTDLLLNHMPGAFKAYDRGAETKMIALLIKEPLCGLIYREDLAITQPAELTDKIFGYCIGLPDLDFLNFLLKKGDIFPSEKKNVSVDLVSAMATRSVDFIYGGFWNIEPPLLNSLGIETKTFKTQELGVPPYYEMIILAKEGSPYATSSFAIPFARALQKSIDYCKSHPEEAFTDFLKHTPDRSPKSLVWQKEAWQITLPLLAENQVVDDQLVQEFYLWQISQGIIQGEFDYQLLTHL